jgi:hypothetical protein
VSLSLLFFHGFLMDHFGRHMDLGFILFGVNGHAFHVFSNELFYFLLLLVFLFLFLDDRFKLVGFCESGSYTPGIFNFKRLFSLRLCLHRLFTFLNSVGEGGLALVALFSVRNGFRCLGIGRTLAYTFFISGLFLKKLARKTTSSISNRLHAALACGLSVRSIL